jgi:type VI secretion system secreted protein Hcp
MSSVKFDKNGKPTSSGDMFLKLTGVTGESADDSHRGEIDVVSWSWGIFGQYDGYGGSNKAGKSRIKDIQIHKRVDKASVTLMSFCSTYRSVDAGTLTVRKAGSTALEYFKIELKRVLVKSVELQTHDSDVSESVTLGFGAIKLTYLPQSATGAMGGGAVVFAADDLDAAIPPGGGGG